MSSCFCCSAGVQINLFFVIHKVAWQVHSDKKHLLCNQYSNCKTGISASGNICRTTVYVPMIQTPVVIEHNSGSLIHFAVSAAKAGVIRIRILHFITPSETHQNQHKSIMNHTVPCQLNFIGVFQ